MGGSRKRKQRASQVSSEESDDENTKGTYGSSNIQAFNWLMDEEMRSRKEETEMSYRNKAKQMEEENNIMRRSTEVASNETVIGQQKNDLISLNFHSSDENLDVLKLAFSLQ